MTGKEKARKNPRRWLKWMSTGPSSSPKKKELEKQEAGPVKVIPVPSLPEEKLHEELDKFTRKQRWQAHAKKLCKQESLVAGVPSTHPPHHTCSVTFLLLQTQMS